MKKWIFIFISLFFIFSCSKKDYILPDECLPNAYKGQYYQYIINIEGDKVVDLRFKITFSPENTGLTWQANDNAGSIPPIITKDYNSITISGTPKISGGVYIDFDWRTVGTNISTGKHFQKRYILKVEE